MIFPLKELIEYDKNMYEITAASFRRSFQLSKLYDAKEDDARYWVDENDGKVVSLAARQVFYKQVEFRLATE
ncbi:MAG: DNA-directed RNA polymerase subunit omega [Treponema sp.]|nr:DNA-directed RNA polymerase subunit omega [Treponema sp.]